MKEKGFSDSLLNITTLCRSTVALQPPPHSHCIINYPTFPFHYKYTVLDCHPPDTPFSHVFIPRIHSHDHLLGARVPFGRFRHSSCPKDSNEFRKFENSSIFTLFWGTLKSKTLGSHGWSRVGTSKIIS